VVVDQGGVHLRLTETGGLIVTEDPVQGVFEVIANLPKHPAGHTTPVGHPTFVLPRALSMHVLEPLELPTHPDPRVVYVGRAYSGGGGGAAFLTVVWFTPSTADSVTGSADGTHAATTLGLCAAWRDVSGSMARGGGGSTQGASGSYVELGMGVLPGTGRGSVELGGENSNIPFPRNAQLSDSMEPLLGEFMSDVSAVVHEVLPPRLMAAHAPPLACPQHMVHGYQYPTLRPGTPPLRSHQVVIRGPGSLACDRSAWMGVSDLHVDKWDGGGELGTCTVHTCSMRVHNPLHSMHETNANPREAELLHARGLAVFPGRGGGRGVHIRSMVPGWHCAIFMRTHEMLHGGVVLPEDDIEGFALPELEMMRVVTYPLRRIETLLERLGQNPHLSSKVSMASCAHIENRMRRESEGQLTVSA
jgi:hypothetical protein